MTRSFFATVLTAVLLACSCSQQTTEPSGNPDNGKDDTPVKLDIKIITEQARSITTTSATVSASYQGAVTEIRDRGFVYGLSAQKLDQTAGLSSATESSGSFTATLSSLEPGQTYYYKAYLTVWSEEEKQYVDFFGDLLDFCTEAPPQQPAAKPVYLGCYEMPAIQLKSATSYSNSGPETYGSTNWYNFETTNQDQMVVTHTYSYNGKVYRNWTALIDAGRKGPQWSAFVMHKDAYPDKNVGRTGSWKPDPGIPASWQQSLASSTHSRGHYVASKYRQATGDANKQTFYYTNQSLQYQNGFNDGMWSALEDAVEANAPSGRDTLYVTVGVLYEDPDNYQTPNSGGTPVLAPSHFFKCLMLCKFDQGGTMTSAKGVAYFFENIPYSGKNYSAYATTIDAVEQRSGQDFFTNVPKNLQDAAEKMSSGLW